MTMPSLKITLAVFIGLGLYLALGVSGAPEHLEGMRGADLIIAVNSDPAAPIFGVAHYGATCDMFELLPELAERLKAGGAG